MRIVIDLQGAQSDASREKNIGKFSLSLAQAIVRNKGEHEVVITLNGLFPETVALIREEFFGLLPIENIRVWHALSPVTYQDSNHTVLRKTAEHIREGFLASLQPDIVYITSLFEGLRDNALTSIGQFTQTYPTAVTLFDFIPSEDKKKYLAAPTALAWYENKMGQIRRADLWLAISNEARMQGIEQLGLPQDKVIDLGIAGSMPAKMMVGSFDDHVYEEYCPDEKEFWDATAQRTISVFEECNATRKAINTVKPLARRPKLAYVSPLPPERSGIADYSAEILPELARSYDIDVIVNQGSVSDMWVNANCSIRNPAWLLSHAHEYDRVLYHFGNSPAHQHMFELLERVPGVVVLHDFFLSGIVSFMECAGHVPLKWVKELYSVSGYWSIQERAQAKTHEVTQAIVASYPCNFSVIDQALGLIVHSNHSRELAQSFYGTSIAKNWSVLPLPRAPQQLSDKGSARADLDIAQEEFVVCSFGSLGQTKLNHRLVNAWVRSSLSKNKHCLLVFVGENHHTDYGSEMNYLIEKSGLSDRISITGWVDAKQYHQYLAAADVAVQLRTSSRGETSAAVLDCFNYGLPTIVNANGALAELKDDAVFKLQDKFEDGELQKALETLWQDNCQRRILGEKGREIVRTRHAPRVCADQYVQAVESYYNQTENDINHLVQKIISLDGVPFENEFLQRLAKTLAKNSSRIAPKRQLLVDISAIVQNDLKTGIQRVVRALLLELIKAPPDGYSVEPVYMTDADGYWHYLYARRYTLGLLGCPQDWLADDHLEARVGDLLLTLDLTGGLVVEAEKAGVYRELKMVGLDFWFVVYDILPILSPEKFPPNTSPVFREWLMSVCRLADGVLCISRSVANEFTEFLKEADIKRLRPLKPHWFHLGADVKSSVPSLGLPMDAPQVLESLTARPTFLMVGTIEPRKGHPQTLTAFDLLWQQGVDVNLVIVGKEGWMMEDLADSIRDHDNFEKQLFWLDSISDEYLEEIYKATTCLIAASEGEGFGLPLIEAAQHKISIIARDIPVFKEVAGEYAFYFAGLKPDDIASAVKQWLANSEKEQVPRSDAMPWLTWKQSSQQLIDVVLNSGVEFGLRAKAAQPDDVIVQNEMPISQFTETSYGATRADQFDETTANILSLPETARTLSRQAKAKRKKR